MIWFLVQTSLYISTINNIICSNIYGYNDNFYLYFTLNDKILLRNICLSSIESSMLIYIALLIIFNEKSNKYIGNYEE